MGGRLHGTFKEGGGFTYLMHIKPFHHVSVERRKETKKMGKDDTFREVEGGGRTKEKGP